MDFGVRVEALREMETVIDSLEIRFNSHRLSGIVAEEGELIFPVTRDQFAHGTHQTLHLRSPEFETGEGDTRELGIPVFSINYAPLSASA